MGSPSAEAHIEAQARLRAGIVDGVRLAWQAQPGYDEENVDPFIALATPFVRAGQRQAIALTNAFLAQALQRRPASRSTTSSASFATAPRSKRSTADRSSPSGPH
jgi:hypothetical protein